MILARPTRTMKVARVMAAALFGCTALVLLALPAAAAELAILRNGFSIRHDHRIVIGDTTRLFLSADEQSFTDVATSEITGYEKDLSPPPQPVAQTQARNPQAVSTPSVHPTVDLNQVVNSASADYHLDPDLVNSVIRAESGFNSHAVSPKGARGLMQLMPSTADALGVKDAFDPQANVGGGSRYLRELLERYNFDLVKALAAYNAGPERVEQYKGVPPFHETRAYVARIIHDYNQKVVREERAAALAQKQAKAQATKKASASTTHPPSTSKSVASTHSSSTAPKHSANAGTQLASSVTKSPR